jgi:hypothetical protein
MTPPAAPKNQTPFDDEISLLDIIQFFKANLIKILFFVMLGGMLAALYVKNNIEEYRGTLYLSPAKFAGDFITEPKVILTKLKTNSFYNEKLLLLCKPSNYKSKDLKDINRIINKMSVSITDGNLIKLTLEDSSKEMIDLCLEGISSEIIASEVNTLEFLIQSKKNNIALNEERLGLLTNEFSKNNFNSERSLSAYSFFLSDPGIYKLIEEMKTSLDPNKTHQTFKLLPINIEIINGYSLEMAITLGLFLGGILGIFVSAFSIFIKKIEKKLN